MPIDGYDDFFNKKNLGKTVKNFDDFEKTKDVIAEEPVVEPVIAEEPAKE